MNLSVVYEDNHIIVVEKPFGVLSQAGSLDLDDMLTLVKAYIKEKYNKPGNVFLGLVHRLDTNVGGLMVFARTSKAAKRLSEQIRNNLFTKKYLAVCNGRVESFGSVELIDYLAKDEQNKKAIISNQTEGKISKLRFQVLTSKEFLNQLYTLVKIELETGRFHQIRAQFASIGHPLYNDGKYGTSVNGFDLGLYAYELSFTHPTLSNELIFKSLPKSGVFKYFEDDIVNIGGSL